MLAYKYHVRTAGVLVRRGDETVVIKDSAVSLKPPDGFEDVLQSEVKLTHDWVGKNWGDKEDVLWEWFKANGEEISVWESGPTPTPITQQYVIVHVPILSDSVLMIRKKRPDWQAGKLNLPGGHIEEGETPAEAAARELFEETGLIAGSVEEVGRIHGSSGALVHVFTIFGRSGEIEQKTDEPLERIKTRLLGLRSDLADYNLVITQGLIDGNMFNWDIYHERGSYRVQIPYK